MKISHALLVIILFVSLSLSPVLAQEQKPETAPEQEEAIQEPGIKESFENKINAFKGKEKVSVMVQTDEKERVTLEVTIELPYSLNILKKARETALIYVKNLLVDPENAPDALFLHFTNEYAGKILDVYIGKDRIYPKIRRRIRPIVKWDQIEDHIAFFKKLREIKKRDSKNPYREVWYKAYLYPPEWPQTEDLRLKESKD